MISLHRYCRLGSFHSFVQEQFSKERSADITSHHHHLYDDREKEKRKFLSRSHRDASFLSDHCFEWWDIRILPLFFLSFFLLPSSFFFSLSSPLWLLSLCLCCSWLDPFICSLVEFAGKLIVLDGYTLFHFSFCLDFRVSLVLFLFPFVEDVCYTPLSASF